jgi:diacylglycerol kinase (ATP)
VRKLIAILNPRADRGRTGELAASLKQELRGDFEVTLLQTTARGEAVQLAKGAANAGCDAILAIGGDGTVHEVVNGLMASDAQSRPPLGIVPAGSGNDVAFGLEITKDRAQIVSIIERGWANPVDVARVRASNGKSCYSINNVGLLLEGEINLASHRLHWPRGSGLYVRAMLQTLAKRLPSAKLELTVDGKTLSRTASILSIANGPRSGGKFFLADGAAADDGLLDYVLAKPVSRLRILWMAASALRGVPPRADWIERGTFKAMKVESDIPLAAHVDGEPWLEPADGVRELSVDLEAAGLQVLCPSRQAL